MDKTDKETLQVTKEIIVKFIESGRVSPANFGEIFPAVYATVHAVTRRPPPFADSGTDGRGDDD